MTCVSVDLVAKSPGCLSYGHDRAFKEGIREFWRTVPEAFADATYSLHDAIIRLTLDWKSTLEYHESELDLPKVSEGLTEADEDRIRTLNRIEPRIFGHAEVSNFHEEFDRCALIAQGCFDMLLHEFFLVANLACPGACSGIYEPRDPTGRGHLDSSEHRLGSGCLELAWDHCREGPWPLLTIMPLRDARNWYERLNIGTRQVAATRTERAIFSLLQYCGCTGINPDRLIWLAHCLEALYDSPKEGILRSLIERIFLVLGRPADAREWKKRIDFFYDLRSKFVHGDLDIVSPNNDGSLDESVDYQIETLLDPADHARALILGTFQKLVRNNWMQIDFETQVRGVSFESGDGAPP